MHKFKPTMMKRISLLFLISICVINSFAQEVEDVGAGIIEFLLRNPKTANKMNKTESITLDIIGGLLKTEAERKRQLEYATVGRDQIIINTNQGNQAQIVKDTNGNIYLLYEGVIYPIAQELLQQANEYDEGNVSTIDNSEKKIPYSDSYFNENLNEGEFIDLRDNQVYSWVRIGEQIWMSENLNFKSEGALCLTENTITNLNTSYCDSCGRLYTWIISLNVCPLGWHLPLDEEWKELEYKLGMTPKEVNKSGFRGTNEGELLKEGGEVGFNAVLCHPLDYLPTYTSRNEICCFWTSTSRGTGAAYYRRLDNNENRIHRKAWGRNAGFNVRCIKDQ